MNLFKTSLNTHNVHLNPLIYSTPFGDVHFQLVINEKKIEHLKPLETDSFQKTTVSSWDMENCHVEFLRTHFKPKIPSSMQVDDCMAGIWRIRSFSKEALPIFNVTLTPNSSVEFSVAPESGEGLVSIGFNNIKMQLYIGTEDEENLNYRASINQWLPDHFSGNIFSSAIEPLANGIEVSLPPFKMHDCVQIQFIVAFSSNIHHKDSCWFAVEQSPEYILSEAGVV